MGLFDFLLWHPKEERFYKSWNHRKWTWAGQKIEQTISINEAVVRIYCDPNNISDVYKCTFKISKGICKIRIRNFIDQFNKLHKEYWLTTPVNNIKFKKETIRKVMQGQTYGGRYAYPVTTYLYTLKVLDKNKLRNENIQSQIIRRRGTAIVDTPKGILIASHHKTWLLPGGGANRGESREKAAIRELREETGLRAISCRYLFEYNEPDDGRRIRNLHKVFLIEAEGKPRPNHHDVHHLAFWKPDCNIKLSPTTTRIVNQYTAEFKNK
jgi:ADP-ribose pyrophosphatase YjhB (NUDIX family)